MPDTKHINISPKAKGELERLQAELRLRTGEKWTYSRIIVELARRGREKAQGGEPNGGNKP